MNMVDSFHIVPVGSDGYPAPDLADPPVKVDVGSICLTPSSERTAYTEWVYTGSDWVKICELPEPESEVDMLKRDRVKKKCVTISGKSERPTC